MFFYFLFFILAEINDRRQHHVRESERAEFWAGWGSRDAQKCERVILFYFIFVLGFNSAFLATVLCTVLVVFG